MLVCRSSDNSCKWNIVVSNANNRPSVQSVYEVVERLPIFFAYAKI